MTAPTLPAQWQAPVAAAGLPHQGQLLELARWWEQLGDPVLVALIQAAQELSPSVASARSRLEQARALRVSAGADLLPRLDANASISRSLAQQPGMPGPAPTVSSAQAGLQASWEIDLFGGKRAGQSAASERLAGAQAQWHEARVSVAAELANHYIAWRSCRQQENLAQAEALSRQQTARLSDLSAQAGFMAPALAVLARAGAAEAGGRASQQRGQCELELKALVALTGLAEPALRAQLQARSPAGDAILSPAALRLDSVPAQALAQRPDVFAAEREVAAASADVGAAEAQRYPRLSLTGAIGRSGLSLNGDNSELTTWSVGPVVLSLPIFDAGRSAANVQAAKARYEEAAALYRARVRLAVREVEEALVNLQATADRSREAQSALAAYRAALAGADARHRAGLASGLELEDARRQQLAAQSLDAGLQRERLAAWVSLYRAMGGGWTRSLADSEVAPTALAR